MTPDELKHWRKSVMKFPNQTEAAKALGYSRSRFTELENGKAGETLPIAVALGCAALAAGMKPWPEGTEHEAPAPKKRRSTKKTAAPAKKRPSQKRRKAPGSRGGDKARPRR